MSKFLTADGIWSPSDSASRELVPHSEVSADFDVQRPVVMGITPYVNPDMWEGEYSDAAPQTNAWQGVKFTGAVWARQMEETGKLRAEWDAKGRGADVGAMQHPSVIVGNISQSDRAAPPQSGPFNLVDPSQTQLENILISHVHAQAAALNAATGGG